MQEYKKPIVTINLTPLVDVSLVLVVIFMATAPMFLQNGIIVTSGEKKAVAATQTAPTEEKNIVVKMENERIWLNDIDVTEQDLPELLQRMLAESEMKRVIVNPAREVKHGKVVRIMDIAKQAGGENIVILGKTQEQAVPVK